jgi:hypothetical protein
MNIKELTPLFASLYKFLSHKLNIEDKKCPRIILKKSIENATDVNGYTGNFDYQNENDLKINIFVTDRHFLDILRTFSHEVIHYWQYLNNKIKTGETISYDYAQTNKKMRRLEMEAYLLGNILFRDWQDANRKEKTNVNENLTKMRKLMVEYIITNKNHEMEKITSKNLTRDIIYYILDKYER